MKDNAKGNSNMQVGASATMFDSGNMKKKWKITKYKNNDDFLNGEAYEVAEFENNVLLNEGITALQNLITGAAETAYDNANAYLGVGNGSGSAVAGDTGLQGASTTYATMSSGYPSISGQTTTWRAVFPSGSANYDWAEFTVANGSSNAADNLNRKVSDQGTKAAGQTWTLDLSITWS